MQALYATPSWACCFFVEVVHKENGWVGAQLFYLDKFCLGVKFFSVGGGVKIDK